MVQLESQAIAKHAKMGARQIYEALKDQILSHVYEAGGQLPSSRNLANELGVSRTTVTVAYEQLAGEGFVEQRQGAARGLQRFHSDSVRAMPGSSSRVLSACRPMAKDFGRHRHGSIVCPTHL